MNWKFWRKKPKAPTKPPIPPVETKLDVLKKRMASRELITCSCGYEYTANNTRCLKCGKNTRETLVEYCGSKVKKS